MPRAHFISLFSSLKPTENVSLPNFPVTLGFRNVSCFFLFFLKICFESDRKRLFRSSQDLLKALSGFGKWLQVITVRFYSGPHGCRGIRIGVQRWGLRWAGEERHLTCGSPAVVFCSVLLSPPGPWSCCPSRLSSLGLRLLERVCDIYQVINKCLFNEWRSEWEFVS